VAALRAILQVVIGLSFLLGATSVLLRERKVLGLSGLALSLVATLAGGGAVPSRATSHSLSRSASTGSRSIGCSSPSSSFPSSARVRDFDSRRRSDSAGRPTACTSW
jgi:hypothetical protein